MSYRKRFRKLGLLFVFVGVLIMSFESSVIKFSTIGGWEFLFWLGITLFISSLFMIAISSKEITFTHPKALFASSLSMALSNICFVFAVKLTGISTTVLILATAPIISALLDLVITKKRTPNLLFVASIFVFIGLFIILKDSQKEINLVGVVLAFLVVFFFALMYVILSNYPRIKRESQIALSALLITFISLWFVDYDFKLSTLYPIFLMGFFIMPVSRLLIGNGSKFILSAEVGLLVILESILAPIWGALFLKEALTTNTIIGGLIIIFSILFYTIYSKK